MEEDTESYEEARRNYLYTRFPQFVSIFDIRHRDIKNRFPQNDTFEDQLEYFRQQPRNNEGIQEEDLIEHEQEQELNLQQEDNEEQNNPVEEEQDEERQEQELNLEEEDNEEQENPVEEEQAEVQQNQRQSPVRLGQIFEPDEELDNQVQPHIPAHLFKEEMALTQQTVNAWRTAVERQAQILENGLGVIKAQTAKKEIPFFTGEIEGKLAIEEWFKIAERKATNAGWTNEQRLRFFQEKLIKSAVNLNDSLTPAQKVNYQTWKNNIQDGLADNTTKARKKEQLKTLTQEDTERVRDFKIRIDDYYKIAYGENAATSLNATVIALRNETKKDVLLNGLKTAIADLVWNRPNIQNATYAQTIDMVEECEKIVEIKKISKNKDLTSAVTVISKENEKNAEKKQQPGTNHCPDGGHRYQSS